MLLTMSEYPPGPPELKEYIRGQMRALGIRQKLLAEKTGVSESYVSQVLNGKAKPSNRFLQNLETALELPPGKLFLLVGTPQMDFVRSFFPADTRDTDLNEITAEERTALIGYLSFLRLQSTVHALSDLAVG